MLVSPLHCPRIQTRDQKRQRDGDRQRHQRSAVFNDHIALMARPFHLKLGVWSRCQSYYAKLFSALFRMPQIVLGLLIDPAFCSGTDSRASTCQTRRVYPEIGINGDRPGHDG